MTPGIVWGAALFGSVIVAAALVNWRAPQQRPRVRRAVVLFTLFATAFAAREIVAVYGSVLWQERMETVADVLRAVGFVNVGGLVVFFVLLPLVRIVLPTIASDLLIALAYVLAIITTLTQHGMDPTSALATGAVASAVLAISLQQTLGNILGGVALQLDGSIKEGDWIQLENGKQGKVRAIRWRHTLVETRDWSTIVVPNSQLLATNITILGKRDGKATPQRLWVYFNVDFRHRPTHVIQVVTDALLGAPIENVAVDPKPSVVCMDFAKDGRDSFAYYAVRYWILDLATDDPTSSRVRARVFAALRRAGIPLAVPATTNLLELQDQPRLERRQKRDEDYNFAAIQNVHLFAPLTPDERRVIAAGMKPAIYVKDEVITRQGATAHWLYILTSGKVEVRTRVDLDGDGPEPERVKTVATLEAPSFFGEMGLVAGEPRTADVVAVTDVECQRLGKATFEHVIHERPELANEVSAILAKRRVELAAVREGLSEEARRARESIEKDKILSSIKSFFGL